MRILFNLTLSLLSLLPLGLYAQTAPQTFVEIGPTGLGGRTNAILVDKDDPNIVYAAGLDGGGIWKTINGGNSWQQTSFPTQYEVSCMAQAADGDIYIGCGTRADFLSLYSIRRGGVFLTQDGGLTFGQLAITMPDANCTDFDLWDNVQTIACDPDDSDHILVDQYNGGVWRSFNGGISWAPSHDISPAMACTDIDFIEGTSDVFAIINGNIYKSDNKGANWMISFYLPGWGSSGVLGSSPGEPNTIYALSPSAVIYKTTDGGDNWSLFFDGSGIADGFSPYSMALLVSSTDADMLFFAAYDEMYKYKPSLGWKKIGDAKFERANLYYIGKWPLTIVQAPSNPEIIYVGTEEGVFRTNEAVIEDYPVFYEKNAGLNNVMSYDAAPNYGEDGFINLFHENLGTVNIECNNWFSGDDGVSGRGEIVCSQVNKNYCFAHSGFDVVRTTNDFVSAHTFYDYNVSFTGSMPAPTVSYQSANLAYYENKDSGRGYLFTGFQNSVWLAKDVLDLSPAWFELYSSGYKVGDVAVSANGENLYISEALGYTTRVVKLDSLELDSLQYDSGGGFDPLAHGARKFDLAKILGSGNHSKLDISPLVEGRLFLTTWSEATTQGKLFLLEELDTTAMVTEITTAPAFCAYYDAAFGHSDTNYIMLGTSRGLWESNDQGLTWTRNEAIGDIPVYSIRREPSHQDPTQIAYYIATGGRGAWASNVTTCLAHPTEIYTDIPEIAATDGFPYRVYPNPFAEAFTIDDLSPTEDESISLYSLDGQLLGKRTVHANKQKITTGELAAGFYILQVRSKQGLSYSQKVLKF